MRKSETQVVKFLCTRIDALTRKPIEKRSSDDNTIINIKINVIDTMWIGITEKI